MTRPTSARTSTAAATTPTTTHNLKCIASLLPSKRSSSSSSASVVVRSYIPNSDELTLLVHSIMTQHPSTVVRRLWTTHSSDHQMCLFAVAEVGNIHLSRKSNPLLAFVLSFSACSDNDALLMLTLSVHSHMIATKTKISPLIAHWQYCRCNLYQTRPCNRVETSTYLVCSRTSYDEVCEATAPNYGCRYSVHVVYKLWRVESLAGIVPGTT